MTSRVVHAGLAGSLTLLASCVGPHPLEWGVRFEQMEDRARARLVEMKILRDGCAPTGAVLYTTTLDLDGASSAARPPELSPGRYGFAARARDDLCVWFGENCVEANLPVPSGMRLIIPLVAGAEMAECPPGECENGFCQGEIVDAGTDAPVVTDGPLPDRGPPGDAGTEDGGPRDGGRMDACTPSTERCNGGDDDCDGNTDEGSDDALCGDALASCSGGSCSCTGGLTYDVSGLACLDTTIDPLNCGSVGSACASDERCNDSVCICRPGYDRVSSGECVDYDTDPEHCGGEGNDCSTKGSMVTCRGTCEDACSSAAGQTNCGNACVILSTHPFHCGMCGRACAVDEVCISGMCRQYRPALLCSSCPCSYCGSDECCTYGGDRVCVAGTSSCP